MAQLLPVRHNGTAGRQLRHTYAHRIAVDITFFDTATNYRVTVRNGVLVYRKRPADASSAQATLEFANKLRLLTFAAGDADSPGLTVTGDANALPSIMAAVDRPDPSFNIVEP